MGNTHIPNENTLKVTHSGKNQQMQYICMQMKGTTILSLGWRKEMQDSALYELQLKSTENSKNNSLFAVFDGHGTVYISHFVKRYFVDILVNLKAYKNQQYVDALDEAFRLLDQVMLSEEGQNILKDIKDQLDETCKESKYMPKGQRYGHLCGCTANIVLITEQFYYIANCGDSRSVLCREGYAMNLSQDHKPENIKEQERIKAAGGYVNNGRINDMLSVSRAFGDFEFKNNKNLPYDKQMVTCKPDITVFGRTQRDEFIIIACDGIWENFLKSTPVIQQIRKDKYYQKGKYRQMLENLLNKLIAPSEDKVFGMDNMTAIFVKLNKDFRKALHK